jgi:acetyl esterase
MMGREMSESALDPDIARWLVETAPASLPTTVAQSRERIERTSALARDRLGPGIVPASETDDSLDGPGGPLPIRVLRPAGEAPRPTVVYFHGGGWVLGDIDTHIAHARRICARADAVVVSVGYRCAPEARFPAAFDDAVFATEWASDHLAGLGGDPRSLAVAGDSAGAQLAASVALARRDAGQPLGAQLLLYPVTDVAGRYLDTQRNLRYPSRASAAEGFGLTLEGMAEFARQYVDDADAGDWRVSPLHAATLAGVAPAVVHTAALDLLRDEGAHYAQALADAGVQVTARQWPTLNHGYFGLGGVSAAAEKAAAQAADDLRSLLGG